MTWLSEKPASTPFESVLAHRPELLDGYRKFYQSLWSEGLVPRRILELCRLRVAAIHSCASEWALRDAEVALAPDEVAALESGAVTSFNATERAALTLAERIPYQHHELTDAEVDAVKRAIGDAGCVSLLNALALFDANCRLKLTFDVEQKQMSLANPPTPDGPLA